MEKRHIYMSHSTYRVVAWGFGRLVAAPTGCSIFIVWLNVLLYPAPFNVQGCHVRLRVDVGIDPYIETGSASHSSHRVVAWGFGHVPFIRGAGGEKKIAKRRLRWYTEYTMGSVGLSLLSRGTGLLARAYSSAAQKPFS